MQLQTLYPTRTLLTLEDKALVPGFEHSQGQNLSPNLVPIRKPTSPLTQGFRITLQEVIIAAKISLAKKH